MMALAFILTLAAPGEMVVRDDLFFTPMPEPAGLLILLAGGGSP